KGFQGSRTPSASYRKESPDCIISTLCHNGFMSKRIYLDYASLTPIDPRVGRAMKKYSIPAYANPSSLYQEGVAARTVLERGGKKLANSLLAYADEFVFTSGGTEANGLALEGAGRAAHRSGIAKPHLIISAIEHSSVVAIA